MIKSDHNLLSAAFNNIAYLMHGYMFTDMLFGEFDGAYLTETVADDIIIIDEHQRRLYGDYPARRPVMAWTYIGDSGIPLLCWVIGEHLTHSGWMAMEEGDEL